jgi:hypothetical protein
MLRWLRRLFAPSRVERFIARFERELKQAKSQAEHDNASGRLAYWKKVQARG